MRSTQKDHVIIKNIIKVLMIVDTISNIIMYIVILSLLRWFSSQQSFLLLQPTRFLATKAYRKFSTNKGYDS